MKYGEKSLRHELKYYINTHEYTYLKKRLMTGLNVDKHGIINDGYHIRSLYFDDMYNSAYNEKEMGIHDRKKFRIRIYNKSDNLIKLEKKSKYGQYIAKDSKVITVNEFYKILNEDYQFLLDSEHDLLREFYIDSISKLLKPKVIVDYDREAYTLEAGNVRITFDKNVRAGVNSFNIFEDAVITKRIFDKPIMIMEVKYDSFLPSHVRNLIQICNHDISAASKYLMCRQEINKLRY